MVSSSDSHIVVSAFLDRPLISAGHHQTVDTGLNPLIRTSEIINSFEGVQWENPEKILRSRFFTFQTGSTLYVKPYSCRIILTVPEGVDVIVVELPRVEAVDERAELIVTGEKRMQSSPTKIRPGVPLNVVPGDHIELTSKSLGMVDYGQVELPKTPTSTLLRRILCELRDRCAPALAVMRRAR
jgi:hypothetical protein